MKLAIVGSRGITRLNLDEYITEKPDCVISGGAKGIDTLAWAWAVENHIDMVVHKPDYARYGRAAPLRRNDTIISEADKVIAFWDGKSHGTRYDIKQARRLGKEVEIVITGVKNEVISEGELAHTIRSIPLNGAPLPRQGVSGAFGVTMRLRAA
jgi:hypothetical protein